MKHAISALSALVFFSTTNVSAYITVPVTTLGQLCNSTYVTVVRVEAVSKEKGVIVYRKVRDLKGKYPKELIKHVFDLKKTPAHKGPGDVPIRPNAMDWQYALDWAAPGKTAVMFALKYDPFGDFGHTYIDGCWYATMCPPRDWEFWYSIYSDPNCLSRWCCGKPAELVTAVETMLAGKDAVAPVLVSGTKAEFRAGKAKVQGLRVSLRIHDYNPKRDLVAAAPNEEAVPTLIRALQNADKNVRIQAARDLATLGEKSKAAVTALAQAVRSDASGTVRGLAAEALAAIGPAAKSARPALEAALADPRLTQRPEVLAQIRATLDKLNKL